MSLPSTSSTFFGREAELEKIADYLEDPLRRLITLVGPGGIGKTRLAIEAAGIYRDKTGCEVLFVDLQPAEQPSHLENALLDALRLTVTERGSAVRQIADYLAGSHLLLLLDNFEQVVDAAPLVAELIDGTPGLKVLVTSRRPLRLTQEWLLPLEGLPVPQPVRLRDSTANPSIRLFIDRVRMVKPDLPVAEEMPAIERICRIGGGMPLALEIAASWAHVLGLSEIADEMARDTRFLASGLRNVPDRHKSIQVVFEHSMRLLGDTERTAFHRLSTFTGGFTLAAASSVAGASHAILQALVERSLVKSGPDGRYAMHELIRQYAAEELAKSPEDFEAAREAHSRHFMEFLAERCQVIDGFHQAREAAEVEADYENIRAAWSFAVAHRWSNAIFRAVETLAMFLQFRARYLEADDLFREAAMAFRTEPPGEDVQAALAQLLSWHGWFSLRLGRIDDAEGEFRESLEIRRQSVVPTRGFAVDPGLALGYVAATRGDLATAEALATDALERVNAGTIHVSHAVIAGYLLAHLASRAGDLEGARVRVRETLETADKIRALWFSAFCHQLLGEIEGLEGNNELATQEFQASLDISLAFEDRAGAALSHVYLGELSVGRGLFAEAFSHFEQSREAYLQNGDRGGVARAEGGLGLATAGLGDTRTAAQWYRSALDTARTIGLHAVIFDVMASIGILGLALGLDEDASRLLSYVARQESIEAKTRVRIGSALWVDDGAAVREGEEEDYRALASSLLKRVDATPRSSASGAVGTGLPAHSLGAAGLTEREIEILELVAQGVSNQQVAERLVVSLSTVKWHNYQIYAKLGVRNRAGAIAAARLDGALTSDQPA